jgi:hypothetical protein
VGSSSLRGRDDKGIRSTAEKTDRSKEKREEKVFRLVMGGGFKSCIYLHATTTTQKKEAKGKLYVVAVAYWFSDGRRGSSGGGGGGGQHQIKGCDSTTCFLFVFS